MCCNTIQNTEYHIVEYNIDDDYANSETMHLSEFIDHITITRHITKHMLVSKSEIKNIVIGKIET